MISIEEAKKIISDNLPKTGTKRLELKNSYGRVLAENIIAPDNSPLFDNSAMDGYAVRWADVRDAANGKEVTLSIIGESAAGNEFDRMNAENSAVTISTGAKVPEEFDTVIPIELVKESGDKLTVLNVRIKGQHIRKAGEEFREGDQLIEKGTEITPAQIALLASIGKTELNVYAKPKVTIITTGSELVPYDSEIKGSQIRNSNGIMLEKAVINSGGDIAGAVHIEDSLQKTIDELEKASADSEIILMSGGVSVGPHDHVKSAAEHLGFKELFWRVNQRPGKPFYFARINNCLLFGLPGNPVSALMTYVTYIHPVVGIMQGKKNQLRTIISRLNTAINNRSSRDTFYRVKFVDDEKMLCESVDHQGSHMIMSLVDSDGFIEVKGNEELPENSEVKVILFPW